MKTHFVRLITLGAFLFNSAIAFAVSGNSPQTFTLDGQLYQPASTTPLLDSGAKITVQILNPAKTCILYEEQQTVDTTATNGYFNIQVGSNIGAVKRTASDPGRSMSEVFQNSKAVAANSVPGQTCALSSYSPSSGDKRYFRLTITPSATNVAGTLSPDMILDSVPNALVAQSVQGLERDSILQVNSSGSTSLTQANLESMFTSANYTNLQSVMSGNFVQTGTNGASLPSFAANPTSPPQGSIWYDTVTHQVKYQSNTGAQVIGTSGALGTMASEASADYLSKAGNLSGLASASTARTNLGLGTAATLDVGTGNNNIVQLDSSSKLPAVDGSALTNITAGNIASGTLSASRLPSSVALDGGNSVSATMSLGTTSNNDLALKTNNTTKMTVLANGNIGLGVTSPSSDLSFDGNAARTIAMERHSTADTAGNNLNLVAGSATSGATDKNGGTLYVSGGTATGTGTSKIEFQTATAGTTSATDRTPTTKMTILGNGNVGVGTTSVSARLHSQPAGQGTLGLFIGNTTYSTTTYDGLGMQVDDTGKAILRAGWGTAKNLIVNDNGGNVGIGTASPNANAKLDVNGAAFINAGTSPAISLSGVYPQLQVNEGVGVAAAIVRSTNDAYGANLVFQKTRGTTGASVTTVADGDALGQIYFAGTDGTSLHATAGIKGIVNGAVSTGVIPTDIAIYAGGANGATERMRINSAGNVGMSTTLS